MGQQVVSRFSLLDASMPLHPSSIYSYLHQQINPSSPPIFPLSTDKTMRFLATIPSLLLLLFTTSEGINIRRGDSIIALSQQQYDDLGMDTTTTAVTTTTTTTDPVPAQAPPTILKQEADEDTEGDLIDSPRHHPSSTKGPLLLGKNTARPATIILPTTYTPS